MADGAAEAAEAEAEIEEGEGEGAEQEEEEEEEEEEASGGCRREAGGAPATQLKSARRAERLSVKSEG